ncbi:MAG: YggS family pyridoxal phosphate-dependent enzyme [Clostridia bacterium]|nr:YggS family pyridoxal phosphate-dependent enzyme [Clostridia bacterium]
MDYSYLDKNICEVRSAIDAVSDGREVVMLAAVKSAEVDEINYIHRHLGVNDIGENRVQQLLSRYDALDKDGLNIHFIGHLQTNKVKYIIDKVSLIHSLDSERLAKEIDSQAKKHGIVMSVLVEINSGREENKDGIMPEEALELCRSLEKYDNIKLCGFMTMAPKCTDKNEYLGYFGEMRELALDIWHNKLGRTEKPILSMGMSGSFEEAVKCGSTMVRVGSRLFVK